MRRFLIGLASLVAGVGLGALIVQAQDVYFPDAEGVKPLSVTTVVGAAGTPFQLCWQRAICDNVGGGCVEPYNVQFRRYRAEDGLSEMGEFIHRDDWQASGHDGAWCSNKLTVPDPGHWIYEARFCGPPLPGSSEPQCREFVSVKTTQLGTATWSVPWWLYSYTPRAGARPMWPEGLRVLPPAPII